MINIRLFLCSHGLLAMFLLLLAGYPSLPRTDAQGAPPVRRVNAPFSERVDRIPLAARAIFWFGEVTPMENYVDARVVYNPEALYVTLHIFDRRLWNDETPSAGDLTEWDAATLYLDLRGATGSAPGTSSHRFDAQLANSQSGAAYQAAYRGDGAGWAPATTSFETEAFPRGQGGINSGQDARGWVVTYKIPFTSLGLSAPPAEGTIWGLALQVHDRDEAGQSAPGQQWPESLGGATPSTWARLHFGLPSYTPPPAETGGRVTIRQGSNGATVEDGHVGGGTTCAEPINPAFFERWGELNYANVTQVNVQNQGDVADWPCFSKYYVTFPLEALPAAGTVLSATLTLHQFGNSQATEDVPQPPQASNIQVLTVAEEWNEATLTWNNAPLAVENLGSSRVEPLEEFPGWPGVPRHWDVSLAVARAHAANEPLRLVLYSADGAYHSGKYFSSSDVEEWNAVARPTLEVLWGTPATLDDRLYLPLLIH